MLIQFLEKNDILFERNVSLKKKTWIKTGGIASLWINPTSIEKLEYLLSFLYSNSIKFEIVGHTSNIYYINSYNPEVVISTSKLSHFEVKDDFIECDCGCPVSKVSKYAVNNGFEGFFGMVNLPGTIAAAVCNNSSCFSCDIASLLHSFSFFDFSIGKIVELSADDMLYSFRSSALKRQEINGVILVCKLEIKRGDREIEKVKAEEVTHLRQTTQEPPAYTLGSVFAGLQFKSNTKSKIVKYGGYLFKNKWIKRKCVEKRLMLLLYGYCDLNKYISDKNINTFKWLPSDNEHIEKFKRYKEFINKVCINPKLEIELRYMDENSD